MRQLIFFACGYAAGLITMASFYLAISRRLSVPEKPLSFPGWIHCEFCRGKYPPNSSNAAFPNRFCNQTCEATWMNEHVKVSA